MVMDVCATLGAIFVNLIRMTVVPLIVSLLIATVGSAAASRGLGRAGLIALGIAVVTLVVAAVSSGLVARAALGTLTIDRDAARALAAATGASNAAATAAPSIASWLVDLVPANIVKAAADGALLPLLVFSVLFGLALARTEDSRRHPVLRVAEGVAEAMQRLVVAILALAPAGVFFLAVPLAARLGWSAAGAVAGYVGLVVALTIAAVALLLYPLGILAGPLAAPAFVAYCAPAQAIAFASRSSLASLPAMLEAAEEAALPAIATTLVLPLAAAVYHFGAAVAQMVGVVFLAQLYGIALTPLQLASVVVAVVVGTFAVPGIPGGSIVAMVPALSAAGLPIEGVGILLAVDAIPDMFRTTANVTGSLTLAAIVSTPDRTDRVVR
jgi:Na+/H+-dicarboxylate symporter